MSVDTCWSMFEQVLAGSVSISEFERWLYSSADLEEKVGAEDYQSLLSLEFSAPRARHDLSRLLLDIYDRHRPGGLARDRAERLAKGLLDGTVELFAAVRGLAELHSEGHVWVPVVFVGIDSELGEIPRPGQYALWDDKALAARLEAARPMIEHWRRVAVKAAKEITGDR
ncbi:MAG TPA: hypothetical protein VFV19_12680 [Candidatus Polarisedimenticolaceae bacterium]|nr:hypothetical protein [Candidatus Polarisedimenticolaceae bacterium]